MSQKTYPSRRGFVAGSLAVATLAGCHPRDSLDSGNQSGENQSVRRPNILYITADDLGTRLGAYGHDIDTPNIDKLARQGILFEECHAQSGICGGSRTSILTGLRPETSGVDQNHDPWRGVRTDTVTLPRQLRNHGYDTFAVGKIEDRRNGKLDDPWTYRAKAKIRDIAEVELFMDKVAELTNGQKQTKPFFAAIGFKQPHCPWSDTYRDRYPDPRVLPELGAGRTTSAAYLQGCVPGPWDHLKKSDEVTITQEAALDIARGYLASVSLLDDYVGQVLDMARARKLLDNTIVIFWSGDHGYALGDHDHWGKWIPRQSISRIPLIVVFPDGRHQGMRVKGLMEAVDMYPALLEIT